LGVSVAEIGHVERRLLYHEDRPLIHRKVLAAWRNGLIPLLCVGEKERVGSQMAAEICTHQIQEAVGTDMDSPLWVAYEPLWAIGADKPAPKEYVREVCECLREILHGRQSAVLYGGSAGPGVLTDLGGAVDGVFLGRFAHEPSAFVEVVREASQLMGPVVTEMR
jgi:triosephosphate isomerase